MTARRALRFKEVADTLGVDPATVSRWAGSGALPCVRIGGVRLVRPEDLEQFLLNHLEGNDIATRRGRSTRPVKTA